MGSPKKEKTLKCNTCGEDKSVEEFYLERKKPRQRCKSCTRRAIRISHWNNRGVKITWDEYETMFLFQNGECAVCNKKLQRDSTIKNNTAVIDHDHKTGIVRGLLCNSCNRAIGLLGDNIEVVYSIIDYLGGWKPSTQKGK